MAIAPARVVIESGARLVFASALDYPGWSRSARNADDAVARLLEYADRYRPVAAAADVRIPSAIDVVEYLTGNATTDFGAPGIASALEAGRCSAAGRRRRAALVQACWDALDTVASAAPEALRKGPRGGGRDTSKVIEHVVDAEKAYAGKLGIMGVRDVDERRRLMIEAIVAGREPEAAGKWSSAYASRRIAWHALDHAWEIEDRSSPVG